MQYTPRLIASPRVKITRRRELPVRGESLVKVNDKVFPNDVVLRTEIKGDLRVIKIRELLGIKNEIIKNFFLVKENEEVKEGQDIFIRKGLFGFFPDIIKSPVNGVVEFLNYDTGYIGLRLKGRSLDINSYISGSVVGVDDLSVTLESEVALIKGLYGTGGEAFGELFYLNNFSNNIINTEDANEICRNNNLENHIIAGGAQISSGALKEFLENGVLGFLTASIDPEFLESELLNKIIFIITEGFGLHNEKENISKILKLGHKKSCSINADIQIRAGAIRPELIINHLFEEFNLEEENSPYELREGSLVRVIRGEMIGLLANIESISNVPQIFESGIESFSAKLSFSNGDKKICPLANLELI